MKKIEFIFFVFILCATGTHAATVTESGGGADYSAAAFNALSGDKSGTTYYFSGSFTTRITPHVYGSSSGECVLDGLQSGDAVHAWGTPDTNSALLTHGMQLQGVQPYLVVQDFRMTHSSSSSSIYSVGVDGPPYYLPFDQDHQIFQRNYLYNAPGGNATFRGDYIIIRDNIFYNLCVEVDASENVNLIKMDNFLFARNIIGYDGTTTTYDTSTNLMATHGSHYGIIENNYIFGELTHSYPSGGIAVKEDANTGATPQTNIIFRFNKFESVKDGGIALYGGNDAINDMYVQANRFTGGNVGASSAGPNENNYFLSNIFENHRGYALVTWSPDGN